MPAPQSLLPQAAIDTMCDMAQKAPRGDFLEFGVYKGGSAYYLAQIAYVQLRTLHLFDTFTGIPVKSAFDIQHNIGDFGDTSLDDVKRDLPFECIRYHVGQFGITWVHSGIQRVAFAHIDCDQYTSCRDAIRCIVPVLVSGGIMLFDDYGATSGVTKAVDEAFRNGSTSVWRDGGHRHTPVVQKTREGKAFIVKP